jgi:hypothetical protein
MTSIEGDGWQLVSAEKRHAEHPTTFEVPELEARKSLRPGDAAKLLFDIQTKELDRVIDRGVDRLWVIVIARVGDRYRGVLDNDPGRAEGLRLHEGDEITFGPEHIADIGHPPRAYLVEKYGAAILGDEGAAQERAEATAVDARAGMTVRPERSSPVRWRVLTAFAILPILQALVAFVAFPLVWRLGDHGASQPVDWGEAAREFAIVTGLLGIFVTVAGAVPVVYWLMRWRRVSLARLLLAGLILGNVPFALYLVVLILPATISHLAMGTLSQHLVPVSALLAGALRVILIGSIFGVISAAAFWLMAILGTDAGPPD